jgi:hypothetical protein
LSVEMREQAGRLEAQGKMRPVPHVGPALPHGVEPPERLPSALGQRLAERFRRRFRVGREPDADGRRDSDAKRRDGDANWRRSNRERASDGACV